MSTQHSSPLQSHHAQHLVYLQQQPLLAMHAEFAFEVQELLGEGGMGSVFRVHDKRWGREAALKLLKVPQGAPTDSAEALRLRFLREAKITARLNHPSVPAVHETGQTIAGQYYMLMRVVDGQSLTEKIKHCHAQGLTAEGLRGLLEDFVKVAEAVAYAHSQGIIHRDLKPDNIMVGRHGEVLVMDWGLAKVVGSPEDEESLRRAFENSLTGSDKARNPSLTQAGAFLGTPGYASPEQIDGVELGPKTDVFSLACILSELATGRKAFQGEGLTEICAQTASGLSSPRLVNKELGKDLDWVVRSAGQAELKDRTASAQDLVAQVKACLVGEPVPGYPYTLTDRALRWLRRWSVWIIGATFLTLILSLIAGLHQSLERSKERVQRMALETQQEQLRRQQAEDRERQAKAALKRSKVIASLFDKAREAIQRGAPEATIRRHLDAALAKSQRGQRELLTAAKLFQRAKLKEQSRALLEELTESYPPAYEALYELHQLRLQSLNKAFEWTAPLRQLMFEAQRNGVENEFTLVAKAYNLWLEGDTKGALAAFNKAEGYSKSLLPLYQGRSVLLACLGQAQESKADFQHALSLTPNQSEVYLSRSIFWQWQERYKEALLDLNEALRLRPRDPNVLLSRAEYYQTVNDIERAVSDYSQVLVLKPDEVDALIQRGTLYLKQKNYKASISDFTRALPLSPNKYIPYLNRAIALEALKQYEEALADFERAAELQPESHIAHKRCGSINHRLNRLTRASDDYQKSLELKPDDADTLHKRGLLLHDLGRFLEAVAEFNKALKSHTKKHKVYASRALSLSSLNKFKEALADYNTAIAFEDDNYYLYDARGLLLERMNRKRQALADFDKAVKLKPDYHNAIYNRGLLNMSIFRFKDALRDFSQAIALKPDDTSSYCNRAAIYQNLKQYDNALAELGKAISTRPQDPSLYAKRAFLYERLGRFEDALKDYNAAIQINPQFVEAIYNRALVFIKLKRFQEALTDLDLLVKYQPRSAAVHWNRALLLEKMERFEPALEGYKRCLECDTRGAYTRSLRTKIAALSKRSGSRD